MRAKIIEQDLQKITAAALPWTGLFGKTVLITGANGFVPAYLVETLLYLNETKQANIQVVGLVRNAAKARRRFAHALGRPDLRFVIQDVRDPYTGPAAIDFVIHAASQASPKYYGSDPAGTFDANVTGTLRMLQLAKAAGAQGFVFISSGEVYGRDSDRRLPVKETDFGYLDPTDVRSCYAEGKRAGETLCSCWHAQYKVPAKIVRLAHTYGPGMEADDGRVFADFVADIVAGRDIAMKSDGSACRPFCYLADVTEAIFAVLLKGENGEAYNAGSDKEHSVLQLATLLVGLFPERGCRVIRMERDPDDQYLASPSQGGHFDIAKIGLLGWKPTTSIEDGFRRTIESYDQANEANAIILPPEE